MHEEPEGTVVDALEGGGPAEKAAQPLVIVRLNPSHNVTAFQCERSPKVCSFLKEQAYKWVAENYCRVFVAVEPSDPTRIVGYYSLSPLLLSRNEMQGKFKRTARMRDIPLALIGYMGKHDGTPSGIGAALVIDAAKRVRGAEVLPARGMAVQPEGGKSNPKLWQWYIDVGFTPAITDELRMMWAALEDLIPD